ncbi:hypothetical protein AVEN_90925-1 [Araneus ventricosus]|uniref:Uncharacterized protein n=1 Tax=Araneus ventricosus TaxID=182803 RepID=A0A4Y2L365_ARAVE|nr:hypothetical protein AVEN_90925-1 [Araneus ventricosus]
MRRTSISDSLALWEEVRLYNPTAINELQASNSLSDVLPLMICTTQIACVYRTFSLESEVGSVYYPTAINVFQTDNCGFDNLSRKDLHATNRMCVVSLMHALRRQCMNGPLNLEPRSDDEDSTCASTPLFKFPHYTRERTFGPEGFGGSSMESSFKSGELDSYLTTRPPRIP